MKLFLTILGFALLFAAGISLSDMIVAAGHHDPGGTGLHGALFAASLVLAILNWKNAAKL